MSCLLIDGEKFKMKQFCFSLLLILSFFAWTNVFAQDDLLEDQELLFTFGEVSAWYEESLTIQEQAKDEDSVFLMDQVSKALYDMRLFVMLSLEDDYILREDKGDIIYQEENCFHTDDYLLCQTPYISVMKSYVQSDAYWRTNYLSIKTYYYDDQGRYSGSQRIDAARREDGQVLFYLNIYDPRNVISSRCVVWMTAEGEVKSLYFVTLGMVLDVYLDVDRWQSGEDIVWDESLLYSKY